MKSMKKRKNLLFAVRKSEYAPPLPLTLAFLLALLAAMMVPSASHAQITEGEILKLLAQYDLPTARQKVDEIYRQRPSSATAAYWRALITEDGEESAELFDELILRFRSSDYADRAAYRLAQYHFARGQYHTAQKYFSDVRRRYPQSALRGAAHYFAAKSWLAAGETDSALTELTACAAAYAGTWIASLAREDLDHFAPEDLQKAQVALAKFTVQVGAYANRDNALKQVDKLKGMKYPAEVYERQQQKGKLFVVWVGSFTNREEAVRYGEELRKKLGGPFQIAIREP
jgi:septal ring-binding cell division protein DamX